MKHKKATLVGLDLLAGCGMGLAMWGISSFSYARLLAGGGLMCIAIVAKWSVNRRSREHCVAADRREDAAQVKHKKATLFGLDLLAGCGMGLAMWGVSSFSYAPLLAGGGLMCIAIVAKWSVTRPRDERA